MAGESPGREQQHETSGEAAERTAADPRLAVFREPVVTREAVHSVEGVSEEHAGASVGTSVESTPAHAPRMAEEALSEARPHPAPVSISDLETDTVDDVVGVDAVTDLPTPVNPPAPRPAGDSASKTEPNRDPTHGADESDGAAEANGDSQEAEGERATSADDGPEPGPEDARPEAEDVPPEAEGCSAAAREAEAEAESGEAEPEDARPEGAWPEGARSEGARSGAAEPRDAEPRDAEPQGARAGRDEPNDEVPPPAAKPVVKPLVSDLPPEERRGGGPAGRLTAFRGPVAFGAPGAPAQARTSPQEPAPGGGSGVKGSAAPDAARAANSALPTAASTTAASASAATVVGTKPTAAPAPLPPAVEPPPGDVLGPEGTRGMPVPPTPGAPLKLLAELTNTPPPRQTAIRSGVRRFKIWTPLAVLLALVFVLVQVLRPLPSPELDLTAASTYTFDGTPLPQSMPWPAQGQSAAEVEGIGSLGVHGKQTPVPIASVTKVMTAYLILRDHPLHGKENGPLITVDAEAANESGSADESTAPVREGQKFTERQMLQLLLIPSGNNIARLLARWDSGTQKAFVTKMTKAAAELGMTNTTYTGASGFEPSTKSTAADQLKLAAQVMKNDAFRSVVALPNVEIPGVGTIYNTNNDLVNSGVIGIKTGSSTPAGGALMWAAQKKVKGKEQLILGVTLQQRGGTTVYDSLTLALTNSQKLMSAAQKGLDSATIVRKGQVVGEVDDGLGGTTPVVAAKDLTAIGWSGMSSRVTLTALAGGLPHSAKAGTRVGTLSFGTGTARTSVPAVLQSDLSEPSFAKRLARIG